MFIVGAMKHFIFYITDFSGGGAESVFTRVANSLVRRRHDVTFIVKKNHGELSKNLDGQIKIIELKSNNILFDVILVKGYLEKFNFERFSSRKWLIFIRKIFDFHL